jgi:hypothetical protein
VVVKGTERVDYYVRCVLDAPTWIEELEAEGAPPEIAEWARTRLGEVAPEVIETRAAERRELVVEGRTTESLRRVEIGEALDLLAPAAAVGR